MYVTLLSQYDPKSKIKIMTKTNINEKCTF